MIERNMRGMGNGYDTEEKMEHALSDRGCVNPVIIAGVNKSGTTSVYRYLAAHPQICGAMIKEALFFANARRLPPALARGKEDTSDRRSTYLKIFPHLSEEHKVCLEGSPGYLSHGAEVANRIYDWLPDARLIFVLREPGARFWSLIQSWRSRLLFSAGPHPAGVGIGTARLEDIINATKNHIVGSCGSVDNRLQVRITKALEAGVYANYLTAYFEAFPQSQIVVMFFEDLIRSPRRFVKSICEFINVEGSFYDNYPFEVENKTRQYRSNRVQKIAHSLNRRFERYFNVYPIGRRLIRQVYTSINEKKDKRTTMPDELRTHLAAFYGPKRQELRNLLLAQYPAIDLPPWLD